MRRPKAHDTFARPLDLWQAPEAAGEPLVCVATSFTFDARFFETECLGRFLQMDTHPDESEAPGYLIEREEKLASATVCALVDRRNARDKESLRWDILGVLVPRAIQHSKVSLLGWGNHVRVMIGSGNLTVPGYRKNVEVFGTIDISKAEGGDISSVAQTIDFLNAVLSFAVGDEAEGPKRRALEALASIRRRIRDWPNIPSGMRGPVPVFGLPSRAVLSQLQELWPSSRPPRFAYVLSPFFDCPPNDREAVAGLLNLLAKRGEREVNFYVRADDRPNGAIRAYAPKAMIEIAKQSCNTVVHRVTAEQNGELRELHAKMLALSNDEWQMRQIGSSNFTAAGIGAVAGRGNCEANLVYRLRTSDSDFRLFDAIWPTSEELESEPIIWRPEREEDEAGVLGPPLPAAFQEAIYIPGTKPNLRIVLAPGLPKNWTLRVPDAREMLSSANGGGAGTHDFEWTALPVPFVLEVSWDYGEDVATANWPVNVSNPAELPPPEPLRDLTLEELLEINASARSLPQAVIEALRGRKKKRGRDIELDPLKRLDSSAFLLRRTKRVAAALEGLRRRLEQPVLTREAFEWRLRGPIGPLALAQALTDEARLPGEAKFCLAELALALCRVDARKPAMGGLSKAAIVQYLSQVVRETKLRASTLPPSGTPTSLDKYSDAAFAEAQRC